jgi:hypothetical protein
MDRTAVVARGIPEHGGEKSDGLALDHLVVIEIGADRVDVTGFRVVEIKKIPRHFHSIPVVPSRDRRPNQCNVLRLSCSNSLFTVS